MVGVAHGRRSMKEALLATTIVATLVVLALLEQVLIPLFRH